MRLAVGTVVYPESAPFHATLGRSLRNQTDGDFTLLVLNDGVREDLAPLTEGLNARVRGGSGGPAGGLRGQLIDWAAETADALVFIDADDWCQAERVAWCRHGLAAHDAVAHDLVLVDAVGVEIRPFIGDRLTDGHAVTLDDVAEHNFLGLSNTAARVGPLRAAAAQAAGDVVAFDWALYTALLSAGASLRYGTAALAAYRQHGKNIAKVAEVDAAAVRRAASVKAEHYSLFGALSEWYSEQEACFEAIVDGLASDPAFAEAYLAHARRVTPANPLWWECAPSNFRITE